MQRALVVAWTLSAAARDLPSGHLPDSDHILAQMAPSDRRYLDPHFAQEYFVRFKKKYNRNYKSREEEEKRYKIFVGNLMRANRKAKIFPELTFGMDETWDLADYEVKRKGRLRLARPSRPRLRPSRPRLQTFGSAVLLVVTNDASDGDDD